MRGLRTHNAGNTGLFTLDGTRTFLVGVRTVAVIDPGPNDGDHISRVAESVAGADQVTIVLTHGHGDHAGAASALAAATGASLVGAGHPEATALADGDVLETDAGPLVAVDLPGHTPDHIGLWWEPERALFVGDLLLGRGDTTWVAGYSRCVSDYLRSLDRVDEFKPAVIFPAHGPALEDPRSDVERFRAHRRSRIDQVREILADHPEATPSDLVLPVYGHELPSSVVGYAEESLAAILDYLRGV